MHSSRWPDADCSPSGDSARNSSCSKKTISLQPLTQLPCSDAVEAPLATFKVTCDSRVKQCARLFETANCKLSTEFQILQSSARDIGRPSEASAAANGSVAASAAVPTCSRIGRFQALRPCSSCLAVRLLPRMQVWADPSFVFQKICKTAFLSRENSTYCNKKNCSSCEYLV